MSKLEIPERAIAIAEVRGSATVSALKIAAPIIVAAELRRMANACDGAPLGSFWGRDELRMRADELDPEVAP